MGRCFGPGSTTTQLIHRCAAPSSTVAHAVISATSPIASAPIHRPRTGEGDPIPQNRERDTAFQTNQTNYPGLDRRDQRPAVGCVLENDSVRRFFLLCQS